MLTIKKLISADGLTKYEPNSSLSKEPISKLCVKHLRPFAYSEDPMIPTSLSMQVTRRTYEFAHTYFDEERGVLVEVYREAL